LQVSVKVCRNFGEAVDFFADRLQNFSTRSGAKAGAACSSRQELHVAYLLAKFGLHPAENELLQDCKFVKFCKTCKIILQSFWQTLNISRIFQEFFKNFSRIFQEFFKNFKDFA